MAQPDQFFGLNLFHFTRATVYCLGDTASYSTNMQEIWGACPFARLATLDE